MAYDRLSSQDVVFLHIEDQHQPMHVGALALFEAGPLLDGDGRVDLPAIRGRIGSRLNLVPRFRRRVMSVPYDQGRPIWVDDEHFDLDYHVRLTALPAPGSQAQLQVLVDRIQGGLLDRRRPLWEMWFVEGVEGDRVALIQKTHHALIDGMSGIDVATVLLDPTPDVADVEPEPWTAAPPPDATQLLFDSLVERASEPAEALRSVRAAARFPQQMVDKLAQVTRTVLDLGQAPPAAPWNVPITPHRRLEPARVPLALARAIKDAARAQGEHLAAVTVNDVVLAACTGAIRSYLQRRNGDVPTDLVYRAMVPVSVRDTSEQMALGNRVSMMTADLAVGIADPVERLRFAHAHIASRKEMGQAIGADALMGLTGFAPPTLLALGARLAVRAMPLNTVITNVPGPQFPLYCRGARMLEVFPYVGVVDNMAMLIAVISYDGQLGFGVTGDRSAVPDLAALARGIEDGFADLARALGVDPTTGSAPVDPMPPPEKKAAPKRKSPGKKKSAAKKAARTKSAPRKTTGPVAGPAPHDRRD